MNFAWIFNGNGATRRLLAVTDTFGAFALRGKDGGH